jgi:hypothetical protein
MTDKFIFLDIDGVLIDEDNGGFSNNALLNLRHIIDETNAEVILSSTWRIYDKTLKVIINELEKYDINLYSTTRRNYQLNNRKDEILEWVTNNCVSPCYWVAIDDSELNLPDNHYLRINPHEGLTHDDACHIINIFHNN